MKTSLNTYCAERRRTVTFSRALNAKLLLHVGCLLPFASPWSAEIESTSCRVVNRFLSGNDPLQSAVAGPDRQAKRRAVCKRVSKWHLGEYRGFSYQYTPIHTRSHYIDYPHLYVAMISGC